MVGLSRLGRRHPQIRGPQGAARYGRPMELELAQRDIDILDFERSWWKHEGVKERAIKDRFDMSATRYYQVLNELLENPAALEYDPILVKRLQRLRVSRQRQRTARLLGTRYQPARR